jgi:hypothetical protein
LGSTDFGKVAILPSWLNHHIPFQQRWWHLRAWGTGLYSCHCARDDSPTGRSTVFYQLKIKGNRMWVAVSK